MARRLEQATLEGKEVGLPLASIPHLVNPTPAPIGNIMPSGKDLFIWGLMTSLAGYGAYELYKVARTR